MRTSELSIQPKERTRWTTRLDENRTDPIIEIDTLEYQQTEKIETELEDVDRIRIRKVYAGFSATKHVTVCFQPSQAGRRTASLVYVNIRSLDPILMRA